MKNNSNTNRKFPSAGTVTGNIYRKISGIGRNLKNQFRNFGTDFRKATGFEGPMWTKTSGLQPTIFNEYLPDVTGSFTYKNVNDSEKLREFLASLNDNAKINIEGLPEGMDMNTFLKKVAKGQSLLRGKAANNNLVNPITVNSVTPGDMVQGSGIKLGTLANIGSGIYQGVNAVKNINDTTNTNDNYDQLIKDIKSSAYNNPLHSSYLTADQRDMLYRLKNNTYDSPDVGDVFNGILKNIPQTLLATAGGFASGGLPGAAINGLGSLASGGFEGWNAASKEKQSELQNLYETLLDAEQDYNNMRRPSNLRASGLQRRYSHSLY